MLAIKDRFLQLYQGLYGCTVAHVRSSDIEGKRTMHITTIMSHYGIHCSLSCIGTIRWPLDSDGLSLCQCLVILVGYQPFWFYRAGQTEAHTEVDDRYGVSNNNYQTCHRDSPL